MATWNAAFNASPAGGDTPSQGDDKIREFKVAVYDRVVKEHNFDLTEGGAQPRQGLHKAGSAVAFYQASAPTQRNGVALAAADVGLIWINSTTEVWYRWDGSSWVSAAVDTAQQIKSTIATGTAPLAVASTTKVANLNVDSVDGYGVTTVGNGIRAVHGYIWSNSITENLIFAAIDPAIPNVNDWIPVSGGDGSNVTNVYSFAFRETSTVIRLYGYITTGDPATSGTMSDIITSGATTVHKLALAW